MSLKDQLDKLRAASAEKFPRETLAVMQGATKDLIATGIAEQSANQGSAAPDFSLPNAHGEPVASEALWGDSPAVVSFYRGGWCPYCNVELKALQDRLPEIEALGARLVAITPETPDNALSTQEKNEIAFDVLSDDGNRVASAFGLTFRLPDAVNDIYKGSASTWKPPTARPARLCRCRRPLSSTRAARCSGRSSMRTTPSGWSRTRSSPP